MTRKPLTRAPGEDERYKALERQWQNEVGHALLDKPYETPGGAAVFVKQLDRTIAALDGMGDGAILEVGCGKGHWLQRLREFPAAAERMAVGVDISEAVFALPALGLTGVQSDGEFLPFRNASVAALVYNGSLHHIIDYPAALREAFRVLKPGGLLVLFEPTTSLFTRLVHRVADPFVFRKTVYESPIDLRYKNDFREDRILHVLRDFGVTVRRGRSDCLAYPLTGCYASSPFARNLRLMRFLMAVEDVIGRLPLLSWIAHVLAWRFLIVAVKADSGRTPPAGSGQ